MKPILKIVAICVICAATLVGGCLESKYEEGSSEQDIPSGSSGGDYRNDSIADMGARATEKARATALASLETEGPISPVGVPSPGQVAEQPISCIPGDYYNTSPDQYFIDHRLYNYLDGYTWNRPLVRGAGWGLPEVAELEHKLTEMGCNVTIRVARCKTTINHDEIKERVKTDAYARSGGLPELDQYTEWLMIELDEEMVAYDVYYSCWIFEPESPLKDEYVSNGKYHDWFWYKENTTYIFDGDTWTLYDFKDFDNIYELEDYFLSGAARTDAIKYCENGQWCSYYMSDGYNANDHFMIQYGWWMSEEEFHETETRINKATDWFVLVE